MNDIPIETLRLTRDSRAHGPDLSEIEELLARASLDGGAIIVPEIGFVNVLHVGHNRRLP